MKHRSARDNDRHQTRFSLQPESRYIRAGLVPEPMHRGHLRALGAVVGNLLKCTGFEERARHNRLDYRLERNDVYLPDLPAAFDGYTILHLSDLHAAGLVDGGEGIMRIVETVPSDLAVLTGNFGFEEAGEQHEPGLDALAPIVRAIQAQDGIFGILGDHGLPEMVSALEGMGVRMLMNDAVRLRSGTAEIVLAGVDDPHPYKCHDLQKALSAVPPDRFVILLSHSPEIAPEASRCGVDFYLCGHSTGGQIRVPGRMPVFADIASRGYLSGSWKCGAMQGYTNRGAGSSRALARFFTPPEITLHTLHAGCVPCELFDVVGEHIGRLFKHAGHAVYA